MTEDTNEDVLSVNHDFDELAHKHEYPSFRPLPDEIGTLVRYTFPARLRERQPENFVHALYALRSEMHPTGEPVWMFMGVGEAYSIDSAKVAMMDRWEVVETSEKYGYGVDNGSDDPLE